MPLLCSSEIYRHNTESSAYTLWKQNATNLQTLVPHIRRTCGMKYDVNERWKLAAHTSEEEKENTRCKEKYTNLRCALCVGKGEVE